MVSYRRSHPWREQGSLGAWSKVHVAVVELFLLFEHCTPLLSQRDLVVLLIVDEASIELRESDCAGVFELVCSELDQDVDVFLVDPILMGAAVFPTRFSSCLGQG